MRSSYNIHIKEFSRITPQLFNNYISSLLMNFSTISINFEICVSKVIDDATNHRYRAQNQLFAPDFLTFHHILVLLSTLQSNRVVSTPSESATILLIIGML